MLSLFSFHPSETRLSVCLSLSIRRFSPTVSMERRLSSSASLCFRTDYNVPHPLAITILLKDWILCEIATISLGMWHDGYKLRQLFENSLRLQWLSATKYRDAPCVFVRWGQTVEAERQRTGNRTHARTHTHTLHTFWEESHNSLCRSVHVYGSMAEIASSLYWTPCKRIWLTRIQPLESANLHPHASTSQVLEATRYQVSRRLTSFKPAFILYDIIWQECTDKGLFRAKSFNNGCHVI
jgi:hypothetical protein